MSRVPQFSWFSIYKQLYRSALKFPQYSYREFFKRRIRDHFEAAKCTNISEVEFRERCRELLQVINRQSDLYRSYPIDKIVIEQKTKL
ncbi:unnamed protein product [Thelazia callipaeda]|uniref:Complex1_LYR_dom domain-containing protein n=1 Tax=Thelazia callipaeda TaxID=103827 RepID=A0A0N5CJB7_THECL|nr:unnamed protein product [Thelazia callipaeda]